jgi:hypothetical protein
MTAHLISLQEILDSDDLHKIIDSLEDISVSLDRIDEYILHFSTVLTLGTQEKAEIILGILGQKLIQADRQIKDEVLWLLLATVLSRETITVNSPTRINILGFISCVEDWTLPIFALLTPALDSFLMTSLDLDKTTQLIAEQTLDFMSTWAESYAKAPRTLKQLSRLNALARSVLDKVDCLSLKEEWTEGLDEFLKIASKEKYTDQRIWSSANNLLEKIYSRNNVNSDHRSVKDLLLRLIMSCLAAIETTIDNADARRDRGLSVVVRIDNPENNNSWSVGASAIDKIERFFEEIANVLSIRGISTFIPVRSVPGSWVQFLHMNLSSNESTKLGRAIALLSSEENINNKERQNIEESINNKDLQEIAHSWRDCATLLKRENLKVDLAISTNEPELYLVSSISTEDLPPMEDSEQARIIVLSHDVPQADSLEKVLTLVSLFIQYKSSIEIIREKFLEENENSSRNFSYYRKALEILGLIDWRSHPTNVSVVLNGLPTEEKRMRLLASQFLSSNVGSSWLKWSNVNDLSDIQSDSAYQFLIEVCPSLSENTAKRRAKTLKSWLEVFLQYW